MPLNLTEGHGRSGLDRMQHWRMAYGSAKEADSALQMLEAGGFVEAAEAQKAIAMLDEVGVTTWRLLHPRL